MPINHIRQLRGFVGVDLLFAIAVLAVLAGIILPIIAKHRPYAWVIILLAFAIWFILLYSMGFWGSPDLHRPRSTVGNISNKELIPNPTHLLVTGLVEVNGDCAEGQILLTETTLFAFHSSKNAPMISGFIGLFTVLLGELIGCFIDPVEKNKEPSKHLKHPEILKLAPTTRRKLQTSELLCAVPLNSELKTKLVGGEFTFSVAGYPEVLYKGLIHSRKVRVFLFQRGIPIDQGTLANG